jgi:hypothetical protein
VRKHKQMIRDYDRFVAGMTEAYARVRDCLEREDYVGAQSILARMGVSHAKTSMSLRNVLVRDGLMEDES